MAEPVMVAVKGAAVPARTVAVVGEIVIATAELPGGVCVGGVVEVEEPDLQAVSSSERSRRFRMRGPMGLVWGRESRETTGLEYRSGAEGKGRIELRLGNGPEWVEISKEGVTF